MLDPYHTGMDSVNIHAVLALEKATPLGNHSGMKNRIKELRDAKDPPWSQERLAEKVGTSQPQIKRLEAGERRLTHEWMVRLARALGCLPTDIISENQNVAVAGFVGAGQVVIPFDDHPLGEGLETVTVPAGLGNVVAAIVEGDSMLPRYESGDVILYRKNGNLSDLLGQECIVALPDGRVYLKKLERGSQEDVYTLISHNASPMHDEEVEWAARVRWVERH